MVVSAIMFCEYYVDYSLGLWLYGIFRFGNFRPIILSSENCDEKQNGTLGCANFRYCFPLVAIRDL